MLFNQNVGRAVEVAQDLANRYKVSPCTVQNVQVTRQGNFTIVSVDTESEGVFSTFTGVSKRCAGDRYNPVTGFNFALNRALRLAMNIKEK